MPEPGKPPRNALLIVNPAAGQGRSHDTYRVLEAAIKPMVAEVLVTQGIGDAQAAARQAAEHTGQFDAVLVAGGDGTINEVINGLLAGQPDCRSPLPLGILPLGTQNMLAEELAIPAGNTDTILSTLSGGNTKIIDLGCADGRFFALMAGFGFDAAVVRDVARPIKELIGPAAYAFASLGTLAKYHSTSLRLRLDDEQITAEAYLVVIANAATYAYRQIKLTPFASMTDGWLDICVFERAPTDKVGFVTQIMAVMAGRHLHDPRVRYYRARKIVVESSPAIEGQLDGDAVLVTPLTIDVKPQALAVFVP